LSNFARKESTIGQMVNLLAINAQSFNELPHHANFFWSALFSVTCTLILLWQQLGIASLSGLLFMILLIPFTSGVANFTKQLQIKKLKFQDSRIKTINEILNGIKFIKVLFFFIFI
jgi:ATP-binding cassette subfamily C (CFTR/MRP) protein 1